MRKTCHISSCILILYIPFLSKWEINKYEIILFNEANDGYNEKNKYILLFMIYALKNIFFFRYNHS